MCNEHKFHIRKLIYNEKYNNENDNTIFVVTALSFT